MKYVTGALAVILLILIIIFAVQNRASVDVTLLAWSISLPKIFLILGTYVLGMLSGWGLLELMKRVF
ncbi:MAG TPA: DUF1049 domain-containing protein [Candidatus Methylomirabilis sp.]|nr:DUF1049 domain-containing protein [Candidatus Methylomirabilis sp.]